MRVKKGFINRNVCGESVLLATGQENIDFTNIISLNETANFLWNELAQREDFTIDDMVELLTGEYEVEADEAKAGLPGTGTAMDGRGHLGGRGLAPSLAPRRRGKGAG